MIKESVHGPVLFKRSFVIKASEQNCSYICTKCVMIVLGAVALRMQGGDANGFIC